MAYLHDTGGAGTGLTLTTANASANDPIDRLVKIIKDLSPIILVIFIIWLLLREEEASERPRPNPRWRSLPEWKAGDPTESRRSQLKRLVGKEGYTKVLKRLVAMANLSGNASAKSDMNWMQKEFGE